MPVNLLKTVNLLKNGTTNAKAKLSLAKSNIDLRKSDIEQATKDIEEAEQKLEEPCEDKKNDKPPKKERKARGKGKKKVQIRQPRKYTAKDVKRIAKNVIKGSGDCPSAEALIAAAVLSETNAEHWVDMLIRVLTIVHDMYVILHNMADFGDYVVILQAAGGGGHGIWGDFMDYLVDLAIFILRLPLEVVLLLEPVDKFVLALKSFLIKFRELIISMS